MATGFKPKRTTKKASKGWRKHVRELEWRERKRRAKMVGS